MLSLPSRKRARGAGGLSAQQKAIIASAKFSKLHPWSDYGAARIQRGSELSTNAFGPSWRAASDWQRNNRRVTGFTGRGKYSLGKFLRSNEAMANRFLTKGLPRLLAGVESIKSMSGRGLYSGRSGSGPVMSGRGAYNSLVVGGRPSMSVDGSNDETQTITISHSEYLQDVYGGNSANFSVESWNLNPGLMENFPWLAQIAANYEEYEFIQLMFHFKSTVDASAVNNTNGSTGTIIMATNYNATAPNFTSKETMMQYHGANSGRVVDDHTHGIECDPSKNAGAAQKYVRFLPVQVGQDLKTFDLGKFQLGQVNLPSAFFNQQIGELWVSYTVKLTKPRLVTSLLGNATETRFVSNGGETNLLPFGTSVLTMQQNAINIALTTGSGFFTITFPDFTTGVFDIQLFIEGSLSLPTSDMSLTTNGNVVAYNDLLGSNGNGSSGDTPTYFANSIVSAATAARQYILICRVAVQPATAGVDNQVTFVIPPGLTGTVTQTQLIVRMTNPSLAQSPGLVVPAYINSSGVVTQPY